MIKNKPTNQRIVKHRISSNVLRSHIFVQWLKFSYALVLNARLNQARVHDESRSHSKLFHRRQNRKCIVDSILRIIQFNKNTERDIRRFDIVGFHFLVEFARAHVRSCFEKPIENTIIEDLI